jgi:uncharacterized small protein (DUF1192 family)
LELFIAVAVQIAELDKEIKRLKAENAGEKKSRGHQRKNENLD